jgi:hypothetical protein
MYNQTYISGDLVFDINVDGKVSPESALSLLKIPTY